MLREIELCGKCEIFSKHKHCSALPRRLNRPIYVTDESEASSFLTSSTHRLAMMGLENKYIPQTQKVREGRIEKERERAKERKKEKKAEEEEEEEGGKTKIWDTIKC